MKARLAPFLVLLEARYAPLLFAVAPQSYAVYLWLWRGSDLTSESFWFAVMGALGYELVYVGAIAWAEEGRSSLWTWATATVALLFSIAVAYYVYREQGAWAWLHAGFPLVAFSYTLNMHTSTRRRDPSATESPLEETATAHGAAIVEPLAEMPRGEDIGEALKRVEQAQAVGARNGQATATVVLESPSAYACPHCGATLGSKQALGAAVKNGHCPKCKEERRMVHGSA